jgi:hypothetical protein
LKSLLLILTIVSLLYACKQKVTEEPIPVTPFNLQTDYLNFTEKLNVGDTLELGFDMSLCNFFQVISLKVIREVDNFKLLTNIKHFFPESDSIFFKKFPIPEFKLDSLLGKNVFYDKFPIIQADTGTYYASCFIVYKLDTLKFQQNSRENLATKSDFIDSFREVMRNYYPNLYHYRDWPTPPPPLPPTEVND